MGTTPSGIVYPDPSGVPQRADLQALAESVQDFIDAMAIVRGGVSSITTNSSGTVVQTITFPVPFQVAPAAVTANLSTGAGGWANFHMACDTFTATTFRVVATGGPASTTSNIAWIAVVNPS